MASTDPLLWISAMFLRISRALSAGRSEWRPISPSETTRSWGQRAPSLNQPEPINNSQGIPRLRVITSYSCIFKVDSNIQYTYFVQFVVNVIDRLSALSGTESYCLNCKSELPLVALLYICPIYWRKVHDGLFTAKCP